MLEFIESKLKFISPILKLCAQASILLGLLVTISYCGVIGHYPSGLMLGDSLFFVAASLAFALNYSLVVAALLCAGITISPFLRWTQALILSGINAFPKLSEKRPYVWRLNFPPLNSDHLMYVLGGLFVFLLLTLACAARTQNSGSLAAAVFVMAFLWGIWNTKPRRKEYREGGIKTIRLALVTLIYFAPLAVIEVKGSFLNQAMTMVGVRQESRLVQFDKQYVAYLEIQGIKPSLVTQEGDGIYERVLILFRGIGQDVVMQIDGFSFSAPASKVIIGAKSG
ncbi:MAG: hypothetical protein NVV73_07255 [Cellvibrionaceae bacterium]|nr:hypothetical protein [Cellvibrionaceae bacterium]